MSEEYPRQWAIIKITVPDTGETIYKVLAGWGNDAWKINSGITKIEETETHFNYHGYSGSIYHCHKDGYGVGTMAHAAYTRLLNGFADAGYPADTMAILSETDAFTLRLIP